MSDSLIPSQLWAVFDLDIIMPAKVNEWRMLCFSNIRL